MKKCDWKKRIGWCLYWRYHSWCTFRHETLCDEQRSLLLDNDTEVAAKVKALAQFSHLELSTITNLRVSIVSLFTALFFHGKRRGQTSKIDFKFLYMKARSLWFSFPDISFPSSCIHPGQYLPQSKESCFLNGSQGNTVWASLKNFYAQHWSLNLALLTPAMIPGAYSCGNLKIIKGSANWKSFSVSKRRPLKSR